MSGRFGNATESAMARIINPLSKPAKPSPQTHNKALTAQCIEVFLAVAWVDGESDDGGLEGIESLG